MSLSSKNKTILFWVILFVICAVPLLFVHLDRLTIRSWDEARLAINAEEMLDGKHWLYYTFGYEPDMWNTKPPLMIWSQALSMKLLGVNELSVRLPAALAGLLTGLLLLWFGARHHSWPAGFVAGLTLLCMKGTNAIHVFRTGDFDAYLVLFTTASILFLYEWVSATTSAASRKWALLTGAALMLAIMSKGVAALFMGPVMFLFIVFSKKFKKIIFSVDFVLAALVILIPVAGYYLGRESINPGYLEAVWMNELGGRFNTTLEQHAGPWTFYISLIWKEDRLLPILYGISFILLISILYPKDKVTHLVWYLAGAAAFFLLIISSAGTKLTWYEAPIYPPLTLAVVLAGAHLLRNILSPAPSPQVNVLVGCAIFWLCGSSYQHAMLRNYMPDWNDDGIRYGAERFGYCLRELPHQHRLIWYPHGPSGQHDLFYERMYLRKGMNIERCSGDNLAPKDTLLLTSANGMEWLNAHYEWVEVRNFEKVIDGKLVQIIKHK